MTPAQPKSKLSRLVQRDTLNGTPQEFDRAAGVQDDRMPESNRARGVPGRGGSGEEEADCSIPVIRMLSPSAA